jgi:hypothetical protein
MMKTKCGYTKEASVSEGVRVLVAEKCNNMLDNNMSVLLPVGL